MDPLPIRSEWCFDDLDHIVDLIEPIAKDFCLDTYPNQLEIITADQMMSAYSTVGLPISYHHWSFGKDFIRNENQYKQGKMGLAYEIVINSDPCISYLMEENSLMMQTLVIAHAAYGHNSFFKGNYLFRTWTDASAIIDYMLFAKNFIADCERKHGYQEVEKILDSCHALQTHGVDRYKRPTKLSLEKEKLRSNERAAYVQSQVNDLWRTLPEKEKIEVDLSVLEEPQENLLYFIEKNSPTLEPWQREIVRIVRKMAQYFYPQRQTQVMNEGWATFQHYSIVNKLYDAGYVGDGFMLEFIQSHTGVTMQYPQTSINPYALGFAMFTDIKRICQFPTDEDRLWFPEIVGSDWRETLDFAMRNFKDESFILQYLSPKLIRDFHLFSVLDDDNDSLIEISAIHNDAGYDLIRQKLSAQYNLSNIDPYICVTKVDKRGDRSLTLTHTPHSRRSLHKNIDFVVGHISRLWGFDVHLHSSSDTRERIWTYEHE